MRHFEPARAELDRKIDDRGHLMNVGTMDDRVDGQRHAGLGHVAGKRALALPRALVMGEAVVGLLVRALERQLRMIETGVHQFASPRLVHADARGDQVGVETALRSVTREVDNVAPRRRLAAGKMHVQRAKRGGLAEHPLPGLAVKLIAGALERHWIGAIKTAERATSRKLDQKPDRRRRGRGRVRGHVSSTRLVLRSTSMATTSFSITAGGAV